MKIHDWFLFMVSIALLAVFCCLLASRLLFLSHAERCVGVVREVEARNGRCGRKGRTECTKFSGLVEFQTTSGRHYVRLDGGRVNGHNKHPSLGLYRIGEPVPIVFNPDHPQEFYRDKLWDLWGFPGFLLLCQIFTLLASLRDPELNEPLALKLGRVMQGT